MFLKISNTVFSSINVLETGLHKLSIAPWTGHVRSKGRLNHPRLRNPFWFVRKERTMHNDYVTPENKDFVKEVVTERFGQQSLINGVTTFSKSSSSLIKTEDFSNVEWKPHTRRVGVIARKIGEYPLWKKDGTRVRTTLLQVIDNHVVRYTPPEEVQFQRKPNIKEPNKFGCLLVGAESVDPSLLTKEYCGLFKDSGVMPKRNICRFFVSPTAALPAGTPLNVDHFRPGDFVDVRGKTSYRGFQGVVKRHGFKGMPASHGHTKTHRRGGNIGAGGQKARVWPGTKMPGHMGNRWRVARGLKIWRINTKYNVMWVQGSGIAGDTNGLVYIFDTMLPLRKHKSPPPFPTALTERTDDDSQADDVWCNEIHNFSQSSILFEPEK